VNLLAFEAATSRLSVALYRDGAITEKSAVVSNGGSERLLPWANELLAEAGLTLKQLDGIAFGAGPGGFTGLRLACGVTQGLACGLDLPVVPVGTLAALALVSGAGKVFACLDARMNEVYVAAYQVSGDSVREIMAPKVGAGETAPLPEGEGWRAVYASPAAGEKPKPATTARFAPLTTTAFRVFVPKGEGSSERPNLMWVGEIKAR